MVAGMTPCIHVIMPIESWAAIVAVQPSLFKPLGSWKSLHYFTLCHEPYGSAGRPIGDVKYWQHGNKQLQPGNPFAF